MVSSRKFRTKKLTTPNGHFGIIPVAFALVSCQGCIVGCHSECSEAKSKNLISFDYAQDDMERIDTVVSSLTRHSFCRI